VCGALSSEGGESFFQAGGIFYVGGVEGAVDLAVEAGKDFAGANFYVACYVAELELVDAVGPADGAGDLADEGVADGVGLHEELGVDVAGYGKARELEVDILDLLDELVLCGHHEWAVEGAADGEHDGALGA